MNTSIGIDIGKKKCDYCIIDSGKIAEEGQYANAPEPARQFARRMALKYLKGGCRAACETTGNMWRVTYDAFESAGIEIKLANTYKMAIIAKTAKKTDKVDARKIASILRMDMIPECYVPPADIRVVRGIVRQRTRLVRERTMVINRAHSLMDAQGLKIDAKRMYSDKALEQMEQCGAGFVMEQYARQIRYLTEEIARVDENLNAEAAANSDARLLASMTGVSLYLAILLAAEIGDASRFASPKRMVSWAGLCPTVHQSGDQMYLGRMKKIDRNKLVNWAICEAANVAVQHDPRLAAVYEAARRRHADKHALGIVVVANKMVTIMWHMLKTRTPYKSHKHELYQRKLAQMKKARRE